MADELIIRNREQEDKEYQFYLENGYWPDQAPPPEKATIPNMSEDERDIYYLENGGYPEQVSPEKGAYDNDKKVLTSGLQGFAQGAATHVAHFNSGIVEGVSELVELPDTIYNGVIDGVNWAARETTGKEIISQEYKAHFFEWLSDTMVKTQNEAASPFISGDPKTISEKVFYQLGYLVPDIMAAGMAGRAAVSVVDAMSGFNFLNKLSKVPQMASHMLGVALYGGATGGIEKARDFTAMDMMNAPFRQYSRVAQMAAGAILFPLYAKLSSMPGDPKEEQHYDPDELWVAAIMGAVFPVVGKGGQRSMAKDIKSVYMSGKDWVIKQKKLAKSVEIPEYMGEFLDIETKAIDRVNLYESNDINLLEDLRIQAQRRTGKTVGNDPVEIKAAIEDILVTGPGSENISRDMAASYAESFVHTADRIQDIHVLRQDGLLPMDIATVKPSEKMIKRQSNGVEYEVSEKQAAAMDALELKEQKYREAESRDRDKAAPGIKKLVTNALTKAYSLTIGPELPLELKLAHLPKEVSTRIMEQYRAMYSNSSKANFYTYNAEQSIGFLKMDKVRQEQFNRYVSAVRDLDIYKRHGQEFTKDDFFTPQDNAASKIKIEKEITATEGFTGFQEFKLSVDNYFIAMESALVRRHKAGLISDTDLKNMKNIPYATSKELTQIRKELERRQKGLGRKNIKEAKDIPFLKKSEGGPKSEDVMFLLERAISLTENSIARNDFFLSVKALARMFPENLIAQEAKYKYEKLVSKNNKQEWIEISKEEHDILVKERKEKKDAHLSKKQKEASNEVDSIIAEAKKTIKEGEHIPAIQLFKKVPNLFKEALANLKVEIFDVEIPGTSSEGRIFTKLGKLQILKKSLKDPELIQHELTHMLDTMKGNLSASPEWQNAMRASLEHPFMKTALEELRKNPNYSNDPITTSREVFAISGAEYARKNWKHMPEAIKEFFHKLDSETATPLYDARVKNLFKGTNEKLKKQLDKTQKTIKKKIKELEGIKTPEEIETKVDRPRRKEAKDFKISEDVERLKADNANLRKELDIEKDILFAVNEELKGASVKKSARPLVPEGYVIIDVRDKGKKEHILVKEDLMPVFEAPGSPAGDVKNSIVHRYLRVLSGVPLVKALSVAYQPLFGLYTAPRDIDYFGMSDSYIKGKFALTKYRAYAYTRFVPNMIDAMKKGPKYQEYAKDDGFIGESASMSLIAMSSLGGRDLSHKLSSWRTKKSKAREAYEGALKIANLLSMASEIGVRMSHRDYLMKQVGLTGKKATARTNELLNFSRKGMLMEYIDDMYAFAGASAQVLDGMVRGAKADPKAFSMKLVEYVVTKGAIAALAYQMYPDDMAKVPLDIKLNNYLIPLPMAMFNEQGHKVRAMLKWPDERNPFTTTANILLYKGLDQAFGYEYEEEYSRAWVNNIQTIEATKLMPNFQALFAGAFNIDPMDYKAIFNQSNLVEPKERYRRDTNRLAMMTADFLNAVTPGEQFAPVGVERAAYSVGLANNLGTGFIGSMFSTPSFEANHNAARAIYEFPGANQVLKKWLYWSRMDANMTREQDQAQQVYSAEDWAVSRKTDDIINDIQAGRIKPGEAAQVIQQIEDTWPGNKEQALKQVQRKIKGWRQYRMVMEDSPPEIKSKIPSMQRFLFHASSPISIRSAWYQEMESQLSDDEFKAFRRIGQAFGLNTDNFGSRVNYDKRKLTK